MDPLSLFLRSESKSNDGSVKLNDNGSVVFFGLDVVVSDCSFFSVVLTGLGVFVCGGVAVVLLVFDEI